MKANEQCHTFLNITIKILFHSLYFKLRAGNNILHAASFHPPNLGIRGIGLYWNLWEFHIIALAMGSLNSKLNHFRIDLEQRDLGHAYHRANYCLESFGIEIFVSTPEPSYEQSALLCRQWWNVNLRGTLLVVQKSGNISERGPGCCMRWSHAQV